MKKFLLSVACLLLLAGIAPACGGSATVFVQPTNQVFVNGFGARAVIVARPAVVVRPAVTVIRGGIFRPTVIVR